MLEKEIYWAGQFWIVNGQRSLFWPSHKTLILSDLHLGKSAHFRKHGIPIPLEIQTKDLNNLKSTIQLYNPEKILIVGDLFHAGINKDLEEFFHLTQEFKELEWILIRGNHDRVASKKIHDLGIHSIFTELQMEGILFTHEMKNEIDIPQISGHFHCGVEIKMPNRSRLRLPAFLINDKHLLLPAFSEFTGLDTRIPLKAKEIYAVHENEILEL